MRRFDVSRITCASCGHHQAVAAFASRCFQCLGSAFRVEIERSASGLDWEEAALSLASAFAVTTPIDFLDTDDPAGIYYRTHSFVNLAQVDGDDLCRFLKAPLPERRRMFVDWKREESESLLFHGEQVCRRCRVIFKPYANAWNDSGLCSRACRRAQEKSLRRS